MMESFHPRPNPEEMVPQPIDFETQLHEVQPQPTQTPAEINPAVIQAEVEDPNKINIEFISSEVTLDPIKRNLELDRLFMGRADNKIVIVGNELVYYGGELTDTEVPNLKVEISDYFNPQVAKRVPVHAVVEGRRVVAYSPNFQKAKEYIVNEYKKRREAAA